MSSLPEISALSFSKSIPSTQPYDLAYLPDQLCQIIFSHLGEEDRNAYEYVYDTLKNRVIEQINDEMRPNRVDEAKNALALATIEETSQNPFELSILVKKYLEEKNPDMALEATLRLPADFITPDGRNRSKLLAAIADFCLWKNLFHKALNAIDAMSLMIPDDEKRMACWSNQYRLHRAMFSKDPSALERIHNQFRLPVAHFIHQLLVHLDEKTHFSQITALENLYEQFIETFEKDADPKASIRRISNSITAILRTLDIAKISKMKQSIQPPIWMDKVLDKTIVTLVEKLHCRKKLVFYYLKHQPSFILAKKTSFGVDIAENLFEEDSDWDEKKIQSIYHLLLAAARCNRPYDAARIANLAVQLENPRMQHHIFTHILANQQKIFLSANGESAIQNLIIQKLADTETKDQFLSAAAIYLHNMGRTQKASDWALLIFDKYLRDNTLAYIDLS